MSRTCLAAAAILFIAGVAWAQFPFGPEEGPATRPAGDGNALAAKTAAAAKLADEQNERQYKENADYFVRPGVLANRKEKWVKLTAKATGITPHEPIEFFTIPTDSGKDYESLSVAFAEPSHVHAALEFIGLKPGRPVDYANHHYWPRGERVAMTFEWEQPGAKGGEKPTPQKVRAEDLILDHRNNKPMPKLGLVFVGSFRIRPGDAVFGGPDGPPDRPEGAETLYAADAVDPKSISSTYNERTSVLDVPHQWIKGEVYGFLKANPAYRFTSGQAVTIRLEPLPAKEGRPRVRDLTLKVKQAGKFELNEPNGDSALGGETLPHVLAAFERTLQNDQDPFVTIHVDGGLTLGEVRKFFETVQKMDSVGAIRVEAPPPGQLYYRAFFPKEEWRDRNRRLGRPWELHIAGVTGGTAHGELILPADEIDDNAGQGDLKFAVKTPEDVAKTLAEKSDRFSQTVYIFSPADMTYGQLMAFITPALKTHDTMYVFPPR
jgi:hypothetical protein